MAVDKMDLHGFKVTSERIQKVDEYLQNTLVVDDQKISKLRKVIDSEIKIGLESDPSKGSLKMYITYVNDLPNGTESGEFLAVELSSYRIRIAKISFDKGNLVSASCRVFAIREDLTHGPGNVLLEFIAECVHRYLSEHGWLNEKLPISFNVGYPIFKKSLTSAILTEWTKHLDCPDILGKDIGLMFMQALKTKGLTNLTMRAILNDTVACLVSGAFHYENCRLGVILGAGFNLSYVESAEKVPKWKGPLPKSRILVMNTEMGGLGSGPNNTMIDFLCNDVDREVDQGSRPGNQRFEKLISAMYVAEQIRLHLVHLASQNYIFNGSIIKSLETPYSFKVKYITAAHMDNEGVYEEIKELFQRTLDYKDVTDEECEIVRRVCSAVIERSAHLASTAIAACASRSIVMTGRKPLHIAVDGSMYRLHPTYRDVVNRRVKSALADVCEVGISMIKDGGGVGAALVLAVTEHD